MSVFSVLNSAMACEEQYTGEPKFLVLANILL